MFVKNRMTRQPITVSPDMDIDDAMICMHKNNIRRLPIVDNGKLVGIVTDKDLVRVAPSAATTLSKYEMKSLLSKIKLNDIMTKKNLITVNENAPLEEAALLMSQNRISGLPVLSDVGAVVGMITETDIFNALVAIMGLKEGKTRITIDVEDKIGVVSDISQIFTKSGNSIDSFVTCPKEKGKYDIIIRGNFDGEAMKKKLEEHQYRVTHVAHVGD